MSTWVAALVAAAAITLTYLFCVRPMMQGHGQAATSRAEDHEIAKLREELRALRCEQLHKQPPPP
jgi:cytochrome c-type biogenesis protein CcmH/NrfG